MDTQSGWVIPLARLGDDDGPRVGGKAAKLGQLMRAGFRVPTGFCVPVEAYETFVAANRLTDAIQMELGRKPLASMRWEEIWDAALRIRSAFLAASVPNAVAESIAQACHRSPADTPWAVRSSAPGEDSAHMSFAGLHESLVNVVGEKAVLDAVRVVWASLWSDAALLYRKELGLDPRRSRMAVVVQAMVAGGPSGVAFARDPRDTERDVALVEAVPGPCRDLVDGAVDPDRWVLSRPSGEVMEWQAGRREAQTAQTTQTTQTTPTPVLEKEDLNTLHAALLRVESLFGWPPDMEWTGGNEAFTLLQARPITTAPAESDKRAWYLTLRPGSDRLQALCTKVTEVLIPELEREGRRHALEDVEALDDASLADAIDLRTEAVNRWKKIYWDEFIPFAHGVRRFATYYNDAVRPDDPYEFVGILKGQQMLATLRNRGLAALALQVRQRPEWVEVLEAAARSGGDPATWETGIEAMRRPPGGVAFVDALQDLLDEHMDVTYDDVRLKERPDLLLRNILEFAHAGGSDGTPSAEPEAKADPSVQQLEERLFQAVGSARRKEAEEVLAVARLSWRLRDDDNLLVGRLESQLMRAVEHGVERLRRAGRVAADAPPSKKAGPVVAAALRDPDGEPVSLPAAEAGETRTPLSSGEKPRQLVGQPGSPGMATGVVRRIRGPEDLGRFRAGEVLVCDAIQPHMTHLVPLACAVVERRGGMLIHGAIIARELGLPCVNGIPDVVELLDDGEVISVDGDLGIVTVGPPEFELEKD